MRALLSSTLLFLGMHCGGGPTLPGLGSIKAEQLCGDVGRCDARGDAAVGLLKGKKGGPIFLAEKQGPASYLGKVAPARDAKSVLKTCGSEVVRDDWLESGRSVRVVELGKDGKQLLRDSLKAHLGEQLLAHPELLAGHESELESIVDGVASAGGLQKVSMISQTFWLSDAAFEKRVAACGEEEQENIIYSLTLLELSELTRKELEAKLYGALAAKLPPPVSAGGEALPIEDGAGAPEPNQDVPTRSPETAHRMALAERAFEAVRSLASELRMIAAFGFDEK